MSLSLKCLRREQWSPSLEHNPVKATLRHPRGDRSWPVLVYLRPVEGPVRLTQTSKEGMLPADTVSLRGLHKTSPASFGKIANWY